MFLEMIVLESLLGLPQLSGDLDRVDDALRRWVGSEDPFLTQVASHLLKAGGKRLRPALAVAVGHMAMVPATDAVIDAAASIELVHLGSLYHDDVMDEARTRRTVQSVNARWGNLVAILAGDYLLARASEIAASLGPEVSALLASTIGALCEGQVRELQHVFDIGRTEESYLAAIAGKTASLMAASCRVGALAAQLPRAEVELVTDYGRHLGMAFQIVDDVLDVVSTDEQLGKPAGNDLVEGVYTLPVIRALAQAEAGATLRRLLGRPLNRSEVETVRVLVRGNGAGNGAVADACSVARHYVSQAALTLEPLGNRPVVAALRALGHQLVEALPS